LKIFNHDRARDGYIVIQEVRTYIGQEPKANNERPLPNKFGLSLGKVLGARRRLRGADKISLGSRGSNLIAGMYNSCMDDE